MVLQDNGEKGNRPGDIDHDIHQAPFYIADWLDCIVTIEHGNLGFPTVSPFIPPNFMKITLENCLFRGTGTMTM